MTRPDFLCESRSNKRGSSEGLLDNHSTSSKRPSHQNGGASQGVSGERSSGGTEPTPSTIAAETPETSLQKKDSLRSRMLREAEPSSVSGK